MTGCGMTKTASLTRTIRGSKMRIAVRTRKGGDMARYVMVGWAIAVLAGCSSARVGDEYVATDTPGASATVQARKSCAGAGLTAKELRRFQVYSPDQARMIDRLYYTC